MPAGAARRGIRLHVTPAAADPAGTATMAVQSPDGTDARPPSAPMARGLAAARSSATPGGSSGVAALLVGSTPDRSDASGAVDAPVD